MSNCGHGHVYPAPLKARCGGPVMCEKCAADLVHFVENMPAPTEAQQAASDALKAALARMGTDDRPCSMDRREEYEEGRRAS